MAKDRAQRDALARSGVVESAFEDLLGPAAVADRLATTEADRLVADIAFAKASLGTRRPQRSRPRILGLDARLFVADLHRMHREIRPGH